jgi:pyruvate dehydrogenase E1 component alpha subunit
MSDPAKYRTKEEVEEYKNQDPIQQVRQTILSKKMATEDQLAEIDARIKQQVAEAVQFAEESPYPDASEAFKDVYVQTDYPFLKD